MIAYRHVATQQQHHRFLCFCCVLVIIGMIFATETLADTDELNKMCPVMTDEEIDPEMTIVYEGKTVAFCCCKCIERFQANPEKYLSRLPQFSSLTPTESGGTSDTTIHKTPLLGRMHPIFVHFPIAAFPLCLFGFLIYLRTKHAQFAWADIVPLAAGMLGSILAVISGDTNADHSQFSQSLQEIVDRHETLSIAIMILAIILFIYRIWHWKVSTGNWRWIYCSGLLIIITMLSITGFYGGSLVYGPDHLTW